MTTVAAPDNTDFYELTEASWVTLNNDSSYGLLVEID